MDKVLTMFAEFFIRGIWESPLFLFGTLILTGVKISIKKLLVCSLGFAVIVMLIRELPISYGIHTMLILICLNLIVLLLFKVNLEQSIKSTVIVTCVLFAIEGLNGLIIQALVGKVEFKIILSNEINKLIYFIPSTILFALYNLIVYRILIKKRKGRINVGAAKQADSK